MPCGFGVDLESLDLIRIGWDRGTGNIPLFELIRKIFDKETKFKIAFNL